MSDQTISMKVGEGYIGVVAEKPNCVDAPPVIRLFSPNDGISVVFTVAESLALHRMLGEMIDRVISDSITSGASKGA